MRGARAVVGLLALAAAALPCAAAGTDRNPAGIDWQPLAGGLQIARTETTIGQMARFAAATGFTSAAERAGGGQVYEAGWMTKAGWTWRRPFGGSREAAADEPAVHLAFDEAQGFCRWAGGRLPTDAEWLAAAYTEQRPVPPAPFTTGSIYPYPTGASPAGAQCLDNCGPAAEARAIRRGATLTRGHGHARAGSTPAGVNGLHEMGGNAWEWVDEPPGAPGQPAGRQRRAPHPWRQLVVRRGADAGGSPRIEAGRHRGGLHRVSLRAVALTGCGVSASPAAGSPA